MRLLQICLTITWVPRFRRKHWHWDYATLKSIEQVRGQESFISHPECSCARKCPCITIGSVSGEPVKPVEHSLLSIPWQATDIDYIRNNMALCTRLTYFLKILMIYERRLASSFADCTNTCRQVAQTLQNLRALPVDEVQTDTCTHFTQ